MLPPLLRGRNKVPGQIKQGGGLASACGPCVCHLYCKEKLSLLSIYFFVSVWTYRFSSYSVITIHYYHYLFWYINCPRFNQWKRFQADFCVFGIFPSFFENVNLLNDSFAGLKGRGLLRVWTPELQSSWLLSFLVGSPWESVGTISPSDHLEPLLWNSS